MTLKKSLRTFVLFFIGALLSHLANACPKTQCVRIGTWNLEWLGSEKRNQPADQKTIHAIVDLIANQLSIDIISLEEINSSLDGEVRGENFSLKPWQDLQRELKQHGYQVTAGDSGYAQHVVLAWRTPVTLKTIDELPVPDHYELNESCHSSHLRKPLAGWFRADQFDFWLVGLHLKARGTDSECTSAVRKAQAQDLYAALAPLIKKDPRVILIGDFNANSHDPSLALVNNFKTLDDKENRSPASNAYSYHSETSKKENHSGLIDHILVNPASLQAWQEKSTAVYKPKDADVFANTFSDHVPLWADFYTVNKHD